MSGLTGASSIDVDVANGQIYWGDTASESIQRANLDGSNVETLAFATLPDVTNIAVDSVGGKVYWTNEASSSVMRGNLSGGGDENVATGLSDPRGIALDTSSSTVYIAESGSSQVAQAQFDGSTQGVTIENLISSPFDVAYDDVTESIVWSDSNRILAIDIDGSSRREWQKMKLGFCGSCCVLLLPT